MEGTKKDKRIEKNLRDKPGTKKHKKYKKFRWTARGPSNTGTKVWVNGKETIQSEMSSGGRPGDHPARGKI